MRTLGGAMAAVLAACVPRDDGVRAASAGDPWRRPVDERAADAFPRRVASGIEVARRPERVLAGSVFSAEVLLEVAPDRIVAVHQLAADPRYSPVAAEARAFGKLTQGDGEHMVSLGGDLVVTDAFTDARTQHLLETVGATVLRVGAASSWDDIRANLRHLGYAVAEDEAVERIVAGMDRDLEALRERVSARPPLRVITVTPDLYTLGRGSLFDAVTRAAGLTNIAASKGIGEHGRLTDEQLIAWQPDVLVLGVADEAAEEEERRRLSDHPVLSRLGCVRSDRLVFVPSPLLSATSHRAVQAAVLLARAVEGWR